MKINLVCQHIVPKQLFTDQKETQKIVAGDLIPIANKMKILQTVESREVVFFIMIHRQNTSCRNGNLNHLRHRNFVFKNKGKVMLNFFYSQHTVLHKFIPQGQTMNKEV